MSGFTDLLDSAPSARLWSAPSARLWARLPVASAIRVVTSLAPDSLLPARSISLPLVLISFQREYPTLGAFGGGRGAHFGLSPISTGQAASVTIPIWVS